MPVPLGDLPLSHPDCSLRAHCSQDAVPVYLAPFPLPSSQEGQRPWKIHPQPLLSCLSSPVTSEALHHPDSLNARLLHDPQFPWRPSTPFMTTDSPGDLHLGSTRLTFPRAAPLVLALRLCTRFCSMCPALCAAGRHLCPAVNASFPLSLPNQSRGTTVLTYLPMGGGGPLLHFHHLWTHSSLPTAHEPTRTHSGSLLPGAWRRNGATSSEPWVRPREVKMSTDAQIGRQATFRVARGRQNGKITPISSGDREKGEAMKSLVVRWWWKTQPWGAWVARLNICLQLRA